MTTVSSFEAMDYREGFAGGCYTQGQPICVYRDEPHCDEGTWATAHYLRANSGHPLRGCAGSLEDVVIGRCGDSGRCANLPERCENETSFVERDLTCTVSLDLTDYSPVIYGRCGDDRCVWSLASDCLDAGVSESSSYAKSSPECTSDVVEIGACWAGHAWCAASAESCNAPGEPYEPFYTHNETQEKIGVNCFLSLVPAPPSTRSPTKRPTLRPTLVPVQIKDVSVLAPVASPSDVAMAAEFPPSPHPEPSRLDAGSSSIRESEPSLPIAAVAGIVVGVATLVGLLVGVVAYRMGVRTVDDKGTRSTKRAPVRSVSAMGIREGDYVEDDVSVLEDP